MARGTVTWFNAELGFGSISGDEGTDVSVSSSAIWNDGKNDGFPRLEEGQRVKFKVSQGQKGPQADKVSVIDD